MFPATQQQGTGRRWTKRSGRSSLLSSKEPAERELMGRTPVKTMVKSVELEHDGVPHYSAVGNGKERDRHSPLLSSREQGGEG
jgi:hypothetical protein